MTTTEQVETLVTRLKGMTEEQLQDWLHTVSYRVGYGELQGLSCGLKARLTTYAEHLETMAHHTALDSRSVVQLARRKAAAELGLIRQMVRHDAHYEKSRQERDKQMAITVDHGNNDSHVIAYLQCQADVLLDDSRALETLPAHTAHIEASYIDSTPESPRQEDRLGLSPTRLSGVSCGLSGGDIRLLGHIMGCNRISSGTLTAQEPILSHSKAQALAEGILEQLCILDTPALVSAMAICSDVRVRPTFTLHPDGWLSYDVHIVLGDDTYDITLLSEWCEILEGYLFASV